MEIYLVGGAVRDELLGYPVRERDWVVVGATPDDLLKQGYRTVGKDFPVFLHPTTHEEYALARTERKTGRGYTQFSCDFSPHITLEEDLQRRDLTINAIARHPDGHLIDPYHGQRDLAERLLRHVSPAFIEDPVRVLRVARFAARYAYLGFTIAPETQTLMQDMVNQGEIDALVPDRVWQECEKALSEKNPTIFFESLKNCDALRIIFPELNALFNITASLTFTETSVNLGAHAFATLNAAAELTEDAPTRFAALLIHLGNNATSGREILDAWIKRYPLPKSYRELVLLGIQHHGACHALQTNVSAEAVMDLFDALDVWRRPERLEKFLTLCKADFLTQKNHSTELYWPAEQLPRILESARTVSVHSTETSTLTGMAIKEKLREKRLEKVQESIES